MAQHQLHYIYKLNRTTMSKNKNIFNVWTVCALVVSSLFVTGCAEENPMPSEMADTLALMPAETSVGITADIADMDTRADETAKYAFGEIHSGSEVTTFNLYMPGGAAATQLSATNKTFADLGESAFDLKLRDFNLSSGSASTNNLLKVTRWTLLEALKGTDRLIGAARLSDEDGSPKLAYDMQHARTKITFRLTENHTTDVRVDGVRVLFSYQQGEADFFVSENGTFRDILVVADENVTSPDDDVFDSSIAIKSYKTANSKYAEVYLDPPVDADGNSAANTTPYLSVIVPPTPEYECDTETGVLTALTDAGLTDDDYILIKIDDDHQDLTAPSTGGTYRLKLSDITIDGQPLAKLEAGKHYNVEVGISHNRLVTATATLVSWNDVSAEGMLEGDGSRLPGYTVSEDGKTYTVSQTEGLYAWAKAVQASESKDINLTLEQDVVLPSVAAGNYNWTPIGNLDAPYSGTINGNGHSIGGMTVHENNFLYNAFIGVLGETGVITGVVFDDAYVKGYYAGAAVGVNYGKVENCHVTSSSNVIGDTNAAGAGGLVGQNGDSEKPGVISGCTSSASVSVTSSDTNCGGVAGYNYTTMICCGSTATLSGADAGNVGGIVGSNSGNVVGSWTSYTAVGNTDAEASAYTSCYVFVGVVDIALGLVDDMNVAIKAYNAANSDVCGYGWPAPDFEEWLSPVAIGDAYSLPEGGLVGDTYTAYSYSELLEWSNCVKNDSDLDLVIGADIFIPAPSEGASNWTPVGSSTTPYSGTISGNGYTISGMTINNTYTEGVSYVGLVGYLGEEGKISNLTLEDVSVIGYSFVGAFAGLNDGTIEGCIVSGTSSVSNYMSYVGSIAGFNGNYYGSTAKIIACGSTAELTLASATANNNAGYGHTIGSWATDTDDLKDNYGGSRIGAECVAGTAADINAKVTEMNTALASYGWMWEAGTGDALPTLVKVTNE